MPDSYWHAGGETPLLGDTIPQRFRAIVERFPEREAVVSIQQNRRLTYRALSDFIDIIAKALLGRSFRKGDRIGIWSTDNIEWLALQMATARIGVILVNVNPANRGRELEHVLQTSRLQGLFTIPAFLSSNYVATLTELMPELINTASADHPAFVGLHDIVLYDPVAPDETLSPYPGILSWPDFLAAGTTVSDEALEDASAALDRDDPINIQYTSGTTGFPKAVVLTHHNILNNAYFAAQAMRFTEADRLCVPVPFYHCFGMVVSNLLCLSVGACLVIPAEHFEAGAVLAAIATERCTALHGVPTMFIAELEHPAFRSVDLSSLRTGIMAGAPCPPELMRRVMNDLHCPEILIGYGQTEASPLTHLTLPDDDLDRRTETVGRNLPHQEVKVIDPQSGCTLPMGEVGEICFRGYHLMREYFENPKATADTIDVAGWLRSGDLGTMDEAGYVRVTGRLKDMIIRGGENIYPAEIEAFLFTHPKIAQVAVFGIPDPHFGEEVVAWVQLHEGESMAELELKEFFKDRIAHFKIPKIIRFVSEFPMTVTGKLQKFRMQEIMREEVLSV